MNKGNIIIQQSAQNLLSTDKNLYFLDRSPKTPILGQSSSANKTIIIGKTPQDLAQKSKTFTNFSESTSMNAMRNNHKKLDAIPKTVNLRKFRFREFKVPLNEKSSPELKKIKRLVFTPNFTSISQLYYQYLNPLSPSRQDDKNELRKTSPQFTSRSQNRYDQPKVIGVLNGRQSTRSNTLYNPQNEGRKTAYTESIGTEDKSLMSTVKTQRVSKIDLNLQSPKSKNKKQLLYPYISKREQGISKDLNSQKQTINQKYSLSPHQTTSGFLLGAQSLEGMTSLNYQSNQFNEAFQRSQGDNYESDNNQAQFDSKLNQAQSNKSINQEKEGSMYELEGQRKKINFQTQKEVDEDNDYMDEEYDYDKDSSIHSILESPLSPPPEKQDVLFESKLRRQVKDSPMFSRKSIGKLKSKTMTNFLSFDPKKMSINISALQRNNILPASMMSLTTPSVSQRAKNSNNLQLTPLDSNITPFSSVMTNTSFAQSNTNIKGSSSLNITPQGKTQKQVTLSIQTKSFMQPEQQNKESRAIQNNELRLIETREQVNEEEEENQQPYDENESEGSQPSDELLEKREKIEMSGYQEDQLTKMYKTSYKNINQIIEQNKFFDVKNSIEEDMLSSTLANKSLLPKRLGVLGTLKQSISQRKPIKINENQNEFLNLVLSKKNDGDRKKQKLDLKRLNIGNNYVQMVSIALRHPDLAELYSIDLSYNYLNGNSVFQVSNSLSETIQCVDLSNNNIGPKGTTGLIPLFDSKKFSLLKKLNLENNSMSDIGLNAIIPYISFNMTLSTLNISHNNLSDTSCQFLKKLLQSSSYLQELYLHWNKFSSYGGCLIAQGLSENLNIKVLDLSHNGLGSIPKLKCGQKIINACNVLESAVRHLDISFNQFTNQESVEMGEALKQNRTLYGIHMEGNQSQSLVDPRGQLYFPDQNNMNNHQSDSQIIIQRINGVKTKGPNKLQSFDCKAFDNCWICQGWVEVKFEITTGSSDLFTGDPVFLHLDFEDFQPFYMDKDHEDGTKFVLYKMLPPNRKVTFFFSDPCKKVTYTSKQFPLQEFQINENMNLKFEDAHKKLNQTQLSPPPPPPPPKIVSLSNEKEQKQPQSKQKPQPQKNAPNKKNQPANTSQPTVEQPKEDDKQRKEEEEKEDKDEEIINALDEMTKKVAKKFKVQYLDTTVIWYHAPTYVNYIQTNVGSEIISKTRDYDPNIKAIPRYPETYFKITKSNSWHRGISVFRDYIPDSDELDNRCFEFDWSTSKLPKLLEKFSDVDECKKMLASTYPLIRRAYKYLSCQNVANEVFCITQNPFSVFAQKAQLIDGALIFLRDIDFNFISASNIALKAKTYRNPDKALIRNEFLEILGRIALDKYIRNEKTKSHSEAIQLFFNEEGLLNHLYEYDPPQKWRNERYWNKDCDRKLKDQLTFLKTLYNVTADSRKTEKRYFTTIKSMSLQEFKDMVLKYDLLDDFLVERDINMSFSLAMMTQVDEITNDRIFQMTFVEFLEALSRLAEKKSMTPLGEIPESYTKEERVQITLHFKIESLIALMKKKYEMFILKEGQQQQLLLQQQALEKQLQTLNSQPKDGRRLIAVFNALKQQNKVSEIASTNFLRNLAQKQQNIEGFDQETQKSKNHLKDIISKIIHKDILLPPSLIPEHDTPQLDNEKEQIKAGK